MDIFNRVKAYRYIQLLSLDVVAGALFCGVMAAKWFQASMPLSWWLALPLAVWVVYTADHLIDAYRLGATATSDRHQFHNTWRTPISIVWLVSALICMVVIPFYIPVELLLLGFVAGTISAIHFLLVWLVKNEVTPWLTKELGVAFVYSIGVWGGGLALTEAPISLLTLLPVTQFFFLALVNLLTFAVYEEIEDQKDGFTSWARGLGRSTTMNVIAGLLICSGVLAVVVLTTSDRAYSLSIELTYLVMGSLLAWVAFDQRRFSQQGRYRLAADGAFLIPFIWLFIS